MMGRHVAYVCFGHVDVSLPLVAEFERRGVQARLFMCFARNKKRESVIDFSGLEVPDGFLDTAWTRKIIPPVLFNHYGFLANSLFFVFRSLRARSFSNLLLTLKLFGRLRHSAIIHVSGDDASVPLIFLLAWLFRKKRVLTVHDYEPHQGESCSRYGLLFRKIGYRLANAVIFQNRNDFQKATDRHRILKMKSFYVPFGVLDFYSLFATGDMEKNSLFLFFGRISPYKGLGVLHRAFTEVGKVIPEARLVIAGSGHDDVLEKFREMRNVMVLNEYIDIERLAQLISSVTAVVCPYLDATQSGVLMTAFAFDKPVIASDTGGFSEVIGECGGGMLVAPGDAVQLAAAMIAVSKQKDQYVQMAEQIRKIKNESEYSWGSIGREMTRIYDNLVKR